MKEQQPEEPFASIYLEKIKGNLTSAMRTEVVQLYNLSHQTLQHILNQHHLKADPPAGEMDLFKGTFDPLPDKMSSCKKIINSLEKEKKSLLGFVRSVSYIWSVCSS